MISAPTAAPLKATAINAITRIAPLLLLSE